MRRADHKVYIFKFRPSSHSDDYTIIATYRDAGRAEKVRRALERLLKDMEKHPDDYNVDWSPDEARILLDGEKVWFEVYTAGYLEDVESVIRKVSKPENIECYRYYQELRVRVRVPKGLTAEVALLVLDKEEAEAIRWFRENCGEPKVIDCGDDTQILEWFYSGDGIYGEDEDTLYIGFEFRIEDHGNWEVWEKK